ncbi:acetyl-CoA synthetase-like protein [Aspergillus violaceofuscus CBS 115571]|nr:acetyl-CoA synthetase-like protein [Aspergillus violaceofuscus CBS 115571]
MYWTQVRWRVRCNGGASPVDAARLERAWRQVVERHAVLRTRFIDSSYQMVLKEAAPSILTIQSADPVDAVVRHRATSGLSQPRPVHSLVLCPMANGDLVCSLEINHAIIDARSIQVLKHELCAAYGGALPAEPGPLYSDYIRHLQSLPTTDAMDFWRTQLANAQPCIFPTLNEPVVQARNAAAVASVPISPEIDQALRQFCRAHALTPANVFSLSWALILRCYTSSESICYGYVISGRDVPIPHVDRAVGPFINMVVSHVDVDNTRSLLGIMQEIQASYLSGVKYHHYPLAEILHDLNYNEGQPFFNTVLSVQSGSAAVDQPSPTATTIALENETWYDPNEYDIAASVLLRDNGKPEVSLNYAQNLLSERQAHAVATAFLDVVANIVRHPADRILGDLDTAILSPQDLATIWERNAEVPAALPSSVPALIACQVERQPDALAVCAWDGDFTYRQLDESSSRLAHHLLACGVRPHSILPLCFEKSRWVPVAMLGVLKAGCAAVTMDPEQPEERLRLVVQKTQAVILTSPACQDLARQLRPEVIILDGRSLQAMPPLLPDGLSLPTINPTDSLYLVFSSGTTGTPKGSVMSHQNACSAIYHQQACIGLPPSEARILDALSYAFDAPWFTFLHGLTSGGCLCIPSDTQRKEDLAGCIRGLGANYAILTPSVARLVDPPTVPSLEALGLGGEAIQTEDVTRWTSHVTLFGYYGPSECTICATIHRFKDRTDEPRMLGHSVGMRAWVVDPVHGRSLTPLGGTGELCLEGPLVGQGYLDEPEKTAASFVEDPGWLLRGAGPGYPGRRGRVYHTGDLVRCRTDGSMLYVGRKDTQVKIRGQRVELGEVEYHFRQTLPAGVDGPGTVVVEFVLFQGSTSPVLVAFIPLGHEATASAQSTRAALARCTDGAEERLIKRLPTYMIPRMYVPVAEIPLTTSGKTDRRSLQHVASSHTLEQIAALQPSRHMRRAPTTEMERHLQGLWATILDIDPATIAATDNFLRMGGDSIAAIRLVQLAGEQDILLTVAAVFKSPTLCEMSQVAKLGSVSSQNDPIPPFSLLNAEMDASQARVQVAALCELSPSSVEDVFPCTPLQEGLLSLTVKHQGDYVNRQVFALHSEVDPARFRNAWNKVSLSTSILRTRIVDLPGQGLVQVITSELPEWHHGRSLDDLVDEDRQRHIALGTPLARFGLVANADVNGDQQQYFLLTLHHALYDGWSLPLLLEEVAKAYYETPAANLVSFKSFVNHVTELGAEADSYWQSTLDGLTAVPFPSLPSPLYQPRAQDILEHDISGLQWLQNHITPATAIRAAWALLTAHYTQSTDVVLGSTVTGRQAPIHRIELVEGPTITTVPVRIPIDGKMSLAGLLDQVQEQSIDMIPYEQVGLQRIRRLSADSEQACQFQTLLVVQPAPEPTSSLGYARLFHEEEDPTASQTALNNFNSYALLLQCQLMPTGVAIQMSYDSHVMPQPQMHHLARQFENILRLLCDASHHQSPVSQLDVICEDDLRTIWASNSPVPARIEACMHDVITKQTQRRSAAQAVAAWDGSLTYSELDELSTQLAYDLVNLGIAPQTVIALCFEKSMWMPVAMLGVMKAGCASVTLDITQPEDRLRTIIQQVQPPVVLSSREAKILAQRLTDGPVHVVSQDSLQASSTPGKVERDQLPVVQPTDQLYICFTSGSTGVPKGAVMSHQNMTSAVHHQQAGLGFTESCRVFDFSSYAFDACWLNFLHTMAAGACLCIPSEEERKSDIVGCMRRMAVTYANLTPSTARLIDPTSIPDLQTLVLIGEPVAQQDIDQWKAHVQLKNGYGPAECSAISTTFDYGQSDCDPRTIGAGCGMITWVVEPTESRHLSPYGAVGELWVEGPLVGIGYLGRSDLSAASFMDSPPWLLRGGSHEFPGRSGRVYRTGDLVHYNLDGSGTLVCVGRKDAQVKIRGQRVELGEVEHFLNQALPLAAAEGVSIAVDVINLQGSANPLLVAYLAIGELALGPAETVRAKLAYYSQGARERLADQLPGYMVPSLFLPVVEIPMTTTGKRDRRRLRETWASSSLEELVELQPTRTNHQPPTTDLERQIQQLWAECLNVTPSKIGIHDSFFALGGDSISAMQLSAKGRSVNLPMTVSDIFKHKSIARLALSVSAAVDVTVAHAPEDHGVSFALSPIQQMFADTQQGVSNHFNQSFFVQVCQPVIFPQVQAAVDVLVAHHGMLRASLRCSGDNIWSQQILPPGTTGTYRVSQHDVPDFQAASAVINQSQLSLDIQSGPVMAVDLINTNKGQYLFLVAHHMVVDLVSWRIILADLEEHLTTASLSGFTSMSFQTWCQLQVDHAQSHVELEAVLPAGASPPPPPQLDYWGPVRNSNTFDNIVKGGIVLSKPVTEALLGPANIAFDTQLVELLHASLLHSFAKVFHDRTPPTIYSEGHGREPWSSTIDISRTVGWFTTMFPVVATAEKGDSIASIVRHVKDCRRQIPGNGRPYFATRFLTPAGKRAFQHHGPVEVIFNYLGLYQQLEREDSLFRQRGVPNGVDEMADISGRLFRFALVDISASVTDGALHVDFLYNRHMQHQDSIRAWIEECQRSLQAAAQALPLLQPSYTLCSFPLLRLADSALPILQHRLAELGLAYGQVEDIYPCSPLQNGILLSQMRDPDLYRTRVRWMAQPAHGSQSLDILKLKQAWQQLVDRHPILRTLFVEGISGRGLKDQLVVKNLQANVHIVQSSADNARSQSPSAPTARKSDSLLTLSMTETGVLCELSINHALIDAFSLGILKEELCAAYEGCLSSLAPLYSDYIQYTQSVSMESAEAYWQDHLRGVQPCLFPPLSNPNAESRRSHTSISVPFEQDLHLALRTFCIEHEVTTSNVFHVAWGLVLRAYTGLETVCFGYLKSGRDIPLQGADRTVGPFINMLTSRVDLANRGDSLLTLIQRNQEQYLASLEFQHIPLAKIFHLTDTPEKELFNTAISVQAVRTGPENTQSAMSLLDVGGDDPTEYDILINFGVGDDQTGFIFNFNDSVISPSHAKSALDLFLHAVSHTVQHKDQSAQDANIISHQDLETIWRWNAAVPKPHHQCVHELIMQQAESQPGAAAIHAWDGDLTYQELNDLSTQLACHIRYLGVEAGVHVPLLFEKSQWMSVASLAVMKAGGTMVGLDPSQPEERLQNIIQQVQPRLILASANAHATIAAVLAGACPVVRVDAASLAELNNTVSHFPLPRVDPATSLYLVFTSGSTGLPKGVAISHSNLSTAIAHQRSILRLSSSSRVLEFASYAFDVAWGTILHTLAAGGCVCVPEESERRGDLSAAIRRLEVNYMHLTPTVARLLSPTHLPRLQTLVLSGETVSQADVEQWISHVHLINAYGPAEATVWDTFADLTPGISIPSIGRGVGCSTWVVNPRRPDQLAPVGCTGELWLEGPLVGTGYHHDPERTAAAFVENPRWLVEGAGGSRYPGRQGRLYRTGDLVRYTSDGSIVYVGRKDNQVKIHGQRVELEEIEKHIQQALLDSSVSAAPAVPVVAAVIIPKKSTRPILVAYLALGEEATSSLGVLRRRLGTYAAVINQGLEKHLPTYMRPSIYIPVADIPMTTNGKADRRKLDAIGCGRTLAEWAGLQTDEDSQCTTASSPEELELQRLFSEVLNLDCGLVGMNDSFFSLGGDSITAMQLSAKSQSGRVYITVGDIFRHKTVAQLVSHAQGNTATKTSFEELVEVPDSLFELSPIQQLFFASQDTGKSLFNQSFLVSVSRPLNSNELDHAIGVLTARHSMLRARFVHGADGRWQQKIAADTAGCYVFRSHQITDFQDMEPVLHNSQLSLDIVRGPILAVDLVDSTQDGQQYLFMAAHHLIVDLVSWRIILGDLEEYLLSGTIAGFPPFSFQSWSQLQAQYARDHLPPQIALPFEVSPPRHDYWGLAPGDVANTLGDASRSSFTIDEHLTNVLLGPTANSAFDTQPVEILHAALLYAFAQTFKDRDAPSFFSEGHGREAWDSAIDLSRTVGWFTTIFPVAASVTQKNSLAEVVRCIKDTRRQTPANGWSYFTSRYLNPAGQRVFQLKGPVEIIFNYMGLYQQLERPDALFQQSDIAVTEPPAAAETLSRFALIDVAGSIVHGQLKLEFVYNKKMSGQDKIVEWIGRCKSSLEAAAAELPRLSPSYTICDFPLLSLSSTSLDRLTAEVLPALDIAYGQVEDIYPCAPIQQGILLSQAKNPELYWTRVRWTVQSTSTLPVDLSRLKHAWQLVVSRHAILRTIFIDGIGSGTVKNQVVLKDLRVDVGVLHPEQDSGHERRTILLSQTQLPQHALALAQTPSGGVLCDLEINHGMMDAYSLGLLRQEICAAYSGTLPTSPAPSYRSYIQHLQGVSVDEGHRFWKTYLDNIQPCHFPALGVVHGDDGPKTRSARSILLDTATHRTLRAFCRQHGVTSSNLFYLAWGLLLRTYTRSDRVCFGYLTSGRDVPVPGVDKIIGPLINMLVCALDFGEKASVRSVMRKVQEDYLSALSHQSTPLSKMLQLAGTSGQGLFNTGISVQGGAASSDLDQQDITITDQTGEDSPEYDIAVAISHDEDETEISFDYTDAALSSEAAESLGEFLVDIVADLVRDPDQSVQAITMISQQDLRSLWTWNRSVAETEHACVHDLIGTNVQKRPDAPAIDAWDGSLTYRALDSLSSRLACYLAHRGIQPNAAIPLCFEKSMWMPVAALAVIKAGGACVAMDMTQPEQRLRTILHQVQPDLLLASSENAQVARQLGDSQPVLEISQSFFTGLSRPISLCLPPVMPSGHLYTVFTSGSTGIPKGVIISHANFASAIVHQTGLLSLGPDSRVFDFVSYAFDVSWSNLLHTLAAGACLCIPSEAMRRDNPVEAMAAMQVTHAQLTPSMARTVDPDRCETLRTLILGGEAMSPHDIATWASRVDLRVAYGPAECTVAGVTATVPPQSAAHWELGKIGHGLGMNTWIVSMLDPTSLAPVGTVGELYLEGPLVGQGYLDQPDKTATGFVDDPAWLVRGGPSGSFPGRRGRLYRTGDLVRYCPDGSLLFVGRRDNQVKVRGQRVELQEVESHLQAHLVEAIGVVADVFKPQGSSNAMLVAYLAVGETIHSPTDRIHTALRPLIQGLNESLSAQIPQYMIPSMYIPVASIPIAATGKADRKCLRQLGSSLTLEQLARIQPPQDGEQQQGPQTEVERLLQGIWADVLNIRGQECIGVRESFFALGGDSISAMQLSTKMRSAGFSITVPDIFKLKTIANLARSARTVQGHVKTTTTWETRDDEPFDLAPVQQMFADVVRRKCNHFNQSYFLRIARPSIRAADVQRALEWVVRQHPMLRARFTLDPSGRWTQHIKPYTPGCYRYLEHVVESSFAEASPVLNASQTSLDLETGPLFSADLIQIRSTGDHYLYLVAHHMVVDLVSWRVIIAEIEDHLTAPNASSSSSLAPPMPFQAWCRLQAEHARDHLAPETALPVEIPPPPPGYWGAGDPESNTFGNAIHRSFKLTREVTDLLLGPANKAFDTQPVEILQGALLYSFVQVFQDRAPPTIFSEGHGREPWNTAIDLSRTVGWFTTLLPTVTSMGSDNTLAELVRHTKDCRRQVPGNGWPYFASRYLNPAGKQAFGTYGLPEITFNYLGANLGLDQGPGKDDSLLQPAALPPGCLSDVDESMPRFAWIEVSASVSSGCLEFGFLFGRCMKHRKSIEDWVAQCQRSLVTASELLMQRPPSYTRSDFPLLRLTEPALQTLVGSSLPQLGVSYGQVEDIYPCSPIQQGILLSQAKDPRVYWTRIRWRARSSDATMPLDPDRLARAWTRVVERHPVLRTRFINGLSPDSLKDQLVLKVSKPEIHVISGQEATDDPIAALDCYWERAQRKDHQLHALVMCPADASSGDVFCDLEMNHAITDATSTALLKRDIQAAYNGTLPETQPGPSYSDFIRHIHAIPAEVGMEYWRRYLEGAYACIFPTLAPAAATNSQDATVQNHPRGSLSHTLEQETHASLQAFLKTHELTAFNVFHLAWALILRCFVGSETLCFGYLLSGRDVPVDHADQIIGPFINMLVSRVGLGEGVTLMDAMKQSQADYLDSLTHQHCSLAQIINSLGNGGAEPLYNSVISVQGMDLKKENAGIDRGLCLEEQGGHDPTEYGIMINVGLGEQETAITFSYHVSLLSEEQASGVVDSLLRAVREIIRTPFRKAHEVDLSTDHDQQAIWAWNACVPPTVDLPVHGLVANTVQKQPHSTAICAWDGELSYGQLDELSTTLAHHLLARGLSSDTVVPLCFEKSLWMPVAILAVMKAGGVSVSMDANQPEERLRTIIEQTQPVIILCSETTHEKACRLGTCQVIPVGQRLLAGLAVPGQDATTRTTTTTTTTTTTLPIVDPSHRLYITFTSGSTGTPKGAIVTHSNFSSALLQQQEALSFGPHVRVFDFVSYAWDVAWSNLLRTLVAGGCLCIPSEFQRREEIEKTMSQLRVNYTTLTPSVARLLNPAAVPHLDTLALIGEPLSQADIARWAPHTKEIINTYGPSECPGCVTVSQIPLDTLYEPTLGVGSACNTWIVDPNNADHLVPVGGIGELWLEGPLIGLGYLGLPQRTAESFVTDPRWLLSGCPGRPGRGGRLYRTGDLVRYAPDGALIYIGRKDSQVKIRGQRVELGEIEYHVREGIAHISPVTDDLTVVAGVITPRGGSSKTLVVYLELGPIATGPVDRIRDALAGYTRGLDDYLSDRLPQYMLPNAYIPVAEIPMTVSGKTDRGRLSRIGASYTLSELAAMQPSSHEQRQSPTAPMERRLQQLWATVLGLDDPNAIAADASFFRIGGDSIAAIRLSQRASEDGLALTAADIFRKPRLCDLALLVREGDATSYHEPRPFSLLSAGGSGGAESNRLPDDLAARIGPLLEWPQHHIADVYPTTDLQNHYVSAAVDAHRGEVEYIYMDLPRGVDLARVQRSCLELWRHLDILRTVFIVDPQTRQTLQVVLNNVEPEIEVRHTEGDLRAACEQAYGEDLHRPLYLGRSFTRFLITANRASGDARLTLRLSHAQYDGFSLPIIFSLFAAFHRDDTPPPAAPKFAGYLRHVQKQRPAAEPYWRRLLEGSCITQTRHLSGLDGACRPNQHHGQLVQSKSTVPAPPARPGSTPATVFTTLCARTLAQLTGVRDVVFGNIVSGRATLPTALQTVAGPCVNTIPVRLRVEPEQSLTQQLATVHAQHIHSLPFETSQFSEIAAHCTDWPGDARAPGLVVQFQNLDNLEHDPGTAMHDTTEGGGTLAAYERPAAERLVDSDFLFILAKPVRDAWELSVAASDKLHTQATLDAVLEALCWQVEMVARGD